jgi:hypothetical protein
MQHFRPRRTHARAFAGGENDGKAAAIAHRAHLAAKDRAIKALSCRLISEFCDMDDPKKKRVRPAERIGAFDGNR